jgi:hypothetical protein
VRAGAAKLPGFPRKQRPSGTDGSPPPREYDGVAKLRVVEELAPAVKLRLVPRLQPREQERETGTEAEGSPRPGRNGPHA